MVGNCLCGSGNCGCKSQNKKGIQTTKMNKNPFSIEISLFLFNEMI